MPDQTLLANQQSAASEPTVSVEAAGAPPVPARSRARRWLAMVGLPVLLFALVWGLLSHQPTFYASRLRSETKETQAALAKDFNQRWPTILNQITNEPVWEAEFAEPQLNAWLAEDFEAKQLAERWLPVGVSKLRFAMGEDLLWLGFRYRKGPLSTVIRIGLRTWVPEPNVLALEIAGLAAGALPLPAGYICTAIDRFADANDLQATWYRRDGNLVVLLRSVRQDLLLHRVEIKPGVLHVMGVSSRASRRVSTPAAN